MYPRTIAEFESQDWCLIVAGLAELARLARAYNAQAAEWAWVLMKVIATEQNLEVGEMIEELDPDRYHAERTGQ